MGSAAAVIVVSNEVGIINGINASRMLGFRYIHLIVLSRSPAMTEIAQRSLERGIVHSVTIYRSFNNVRPVRLLCSLMFPKLFLKNFFHKLNARFNEHGVGVVFVQNMISALIFKRAFPDQEFILVDEGLSSYSGRVTQHQYRSMRFKILWSLLYGNRYESVVTRFFLSEPRMLVPNVSQDVFRIEPDYALVRELLGGVQDSRDIDRVKFCYIGVPLFGLIDLCKGQEINREIFLSQAESILTILVRGLSGRLKYKRHPLENLRPLEEGYGQSVTFLEGLWEEICLHDINDETVLFNFFSTAATFPKLVLDKEPTIVFMYKLLNADVLFGNEIVDEFRRTYRDSSKVLVPENLEEFMKIVNFFRLKA